MLWEGDWICSTCHARYPHRRGVAFPAVMNLDWTTTLGEALARRRIFARELEGAAFEGERAERHEEQSTSVARVMDDLFLAAQKESGLNSPCSILDVGAGLCDTSSAWAAMGHDVTAVETEANNLLHIRFEATDEGEPEWLDLPGRRVYAQETRRRPHLFDRIVAPIHRLPFETGSFDVVFCRSVLHHLDDLAGCVREMMRVLKPGGLFIGCSEPARGIFDREDEQLVGGVDKEDGLNEQLPSWFQYRSAFSPYAQSIRIQAWLQDSSPRVRMFERWDFLSLRRRIWPGQAVAGWKLAKLLPFSASINLLAVRSSRLIGWEQGQAAALADFSIRDLADVSCPESLAQSVVDFGANTQRLAHGWRRMRLQVGTVPAHFAPALVGERQLQIGWRRSLSTWDGQWARGTNKYALVTLGHSSQYPARFVRLIAASPGSKVAQGHIRINGVPAGTIELPPQEGHWHHLRYAIPEGVNSQPSEFSGAMAYDVELVADGVQSSPLEGAGAEAGFLVQSLALLKE